MKDKSKAEKKVRKGFPFYLSKGKLTLRELRSISDNEGIPESEQAITSLTVGMDGRIYGGTSGRLAHLFVYDPGQDWVADLGRVADEEAIYHSLVTGSDGKIYGGTMSMVTKNHKGGHLFSYNPYKEKQLSYEVFEPAAIVDLGIPVKHEGINALTTNDNQDVIYGVTSQGGYFFSYDIKTKKTKLNGKATNGKVTRALVCDSHGNVYGSRENAYLFRYDANKDKITNLDIQLPGEKGREYLVMADSFTRDNEGNIYGGTSDGYLFSYNPQEMRIVNLGKVIRQYRIRALTAGKDNKIYGIAGEENGIAHFFVYDPISRGLTDLGMPHVNGTPKLWTGYEFDSMVTGDDGVIYAGESDRISHLFIYYPVWEKER